MVLNTMTFHWYRGRPAAKVMVSRQRRRRLVARRLGWRWRHGKRSRRNQREGEPRLVVRDRGWSRRWPLSLHVRLCAVCDREEVRRRRQGQNCISQLLHDLTGQRWHKRVWFWVCSGMKGKCHFAISDQGLRTLQWCIKKFLFFNTTPSNHMLLPSPPLALCPLFQSSLASHILKSSPSGPFTVVSCHLLPLPRQLLLILKCHNLPSRYQFLLYVTIYGYRVGAYATTPLISVSMLTHSLLVVILAPDIFFGSYNAVLVVTKYIRTGGNES